MTEQEITKQEPLYTAVGFLFGLAFPLLAWVIDTLVFTGGSFSINGLLAAHKLNSLYYIIDMAPFVLGIAGYIIGRQKTFIMQRAHADHINMKQKQQLILGSIAEGIYGVDEKLVTTFFNTAAEELLGFRADEIVGIKQHALTHHTRADGTKYPANECQMYRAVKDGKIHTVSNELFWRKDGTSFEVEYTASPVTDINGATRGAVVVFRDVTKRNALENALRIARQQAEDAAAAKSDFLANMSHEIRTPMNGILGTSSLLEETKLTKKQQQYLTIIQNSSHSLLQIINDILDFSKIEAGKLDFEQHPVDLRLLFREIKSLMSSQVKANVSLELELSDNLPQWVMGDCGRIRQILFNLTSNAAKFTEQGRIVLCAELKTPSPEKEGRHEFFVAVKDTGIGIPEDRIEAIFQKFTQADKSTTRQFGGTGLGLAICSKLVEKMDGKIGVNSKPGKGSSFWFTMQLPEASAEEIATVIDHTTKAKAQSMTFSSPRILIAEDNPVNLMIATTILKQLGCVITAAKNGTEAVKLASNQTFDLIFMDCQMPEMDGYKATGHIRENEQNMHTRPVPIVAFTANAMKGDRQKCLNAGMDGYISKPVQKPALAAILLQYLAPDQRVH